MSDNKTCHNERCQCRDHDRHLCYLMYDGFHFRERDKFRALVDRAEFRCQECGRTANKASSLCSPVAL